MYATNIKYVVGHYITPLQSPSRAIIVGKFNTAA